MVAPAAQVPSQCENVSRADGSGSNYLALGIDGTGGAGAGALGSTLPEGAGLTALLMAWPAVLEGETPGTGWPFTPGA
jgi:hypothetical protein